MMSNNPTPKSLGLPALPSSPPLPSPTPPRPSPFGAGNRFGNRTNTPYVPMENHPVRFDIGLARPQLIAFWQETFGTTLETIPEDTIGFAKLFDLNRERADLMRAKLDAAWDGYTLKGAMLVYVWRDETRDLFDNRLRAMNLPTQYTAVIDPLLLLNVLGRARNTLLLAKAPVAFDAQFLVRSLASDDRRLWALATAGSNPSFPLVEPEPEVDERADEEDDN